MGDEVLRQISASLKMLIRKTDYVGRWGGEEFLIICLNVNEEILIKLAEKMRLHIKNKQFSCNKTITCSFGVSVFTPSDNILDLVKRADTALYKSKESGRDRVTCL